MFNQNGKFTLRAIAVKNGMKNSAELAVVYNIEDLNADNSSGMLRIMNGLGMMIVMLRISKQIINHLRRPSR